MKATTKTLIYFTSSLILSVGTAATAQEFGNSNTPLTSYQYDNNRCDRLNSNLAESNGDFIEACTTAGLGSSISTCTKRLEDCSEEGSESIAYCLNHAITTSQADSVQNRLDSLNADDEENQLELAELLKLKNDADAQLESTLNQIVEGREGALEGEVTQMNAITDSIAQAYDNLNALQLQMREFVLNQSVQCHTEASEVQAEYVAERRRRAANGQRAHLTQAQLISRTGLSVNEASVIKYNRHVRNCTALSTKAGEQTIFGKQYKFQQATINNQKSILEREINRLTAQRAVVRRETKSAILSLDRLQASALSEHTRTVTDIDNRILALSARNERIQSDLIATTVQLLQNDNATSLTADNALIAVATGQLNSSTSSRRTIASDDKIAAFAEANKLNIIRESAKTQSESCEVRSNELNSIQNNQSSNAPNVTITAEEDPGSSQRFATATRN